MGVFKQDTSIIFVIRYIWGLQHGYFIYHQHSDMSQQGGYFEFGLPAPTVALGRVFADIKAMQKDNLNDMPVEAKDERGEQEIKGLKFIAKKIKILLEKNKKIEYNEASRILINNFASEEKAERNIKRRVYDAINVLVSAAVITKDDNKIELLQEKKNHKKNKSSSNSKKDELSQQLDSLKATLELKRNRLNQLRLQQKLLKRICKQKRKKTKKDNCIALQDSWVMPWNGKIEQLTINKKKGNVIIKGGKKQAEPQHILDWASKSQK